VLAVPVLLPLVTAAVLLLLPDRLRALKAAISVASAAAGLAVAALLLLWADREAAPAAFAVYLPSNWPVPFGIALVLDRLSALMVALTGVVGLAALLFSLARWQRAGVYFHVLVHLQLMGLCGAFLTGDLFNLFVFFEVLLAASYGLLLHGGGGERVRTGLHYIAVNLVASFLFLIGIALLYGVTGTLNMADMALKLPLLPERDRGLLHAGAALLAVAFLAKAGAWPLNFWLTPAYAAASAPAAAVFAILTKVGVYALLRLWTLCFPAGAGASALFGAEVLVWGGVLTLAFGSVGMLASQQPDRLAGYSIIATSGTLLAAAGFDAPDLAGGALFYLASSTLGAAALLLLVELLQRAREVEPAPPTADADDEPMPAFPDAEPRPGINLDDEEEALIGRAIPGALAFLGVAFAVCALVISGLPPLSGFVGKVLMMSSLLDVGTTAAWTLWALLVVSGLLAAVSLLRVGMRHFWLVQERAAPRMSVVESLPLALLLGGCVVLVLHAEAALAYTRGTAEALHEPSWYIDAVMNARTVKTPAAGAVE
jgi:multicomponent K+:H+ antiporter subunit D